MSGQIVSALSSAFLAAERVSSSVAAAQSNDVALVVPLDI